MADDFQEDIRISELPETDSVNKDTDFLAVVKPSTLYTSGFKSFKVTPAKLLAEAAEYTAGDHIAISANNEISATYQAGTNITISADGTISATGGGSGSTVEVTQVQTTGTKIATITVDSVGTDLYAPNGGGGASALDDLTDVAISSPTNNQALIYDSANSQWVNGDVSGGSGGHTIVDDSGTALTQRTNLQFNGAYSEDNSTDDTTEVNVVREMTKAEFDLLSDDEKVGFINITDITGGNDDRFQPFIYSEDEREIGVWTDGKPLYQKTLKAENVTIPISGGYAIDISALNVDCIVEMPSGYIKFSTDMRSVPFGVLGNYGMAVDANPTTVTISRKGTDISVTVVEVTIRYTKSTDTAGSGQWTPQGVPAYHYSEDEQVVGTWIDGKTIFEKTFTASFTNIPSGTAQNVADISGLGIDEVISSFGVCKYSAGSIQPDLYESLGFHFYCYVYPSDNLVFRQAMTEQTTDRTYDLKVTIQYTKSST